MTKRHVWIVALCVSVFLNLLLAGYIVGQATQPATMDLSYGFPRLLRALPEERVDELMASIRDQRRDLREVYRNVGRAQEEMTKDFLANPFDIEQFRKSSAHYGTEYCTARERTDQVFLYLAEQLTQEEREQMELARHEWRRVERNSRARQTSTNQPNEEREE